MRTKRPWRAPEMGQREPGAVIGAAQRHRHVVLPRLVVDGVDGDDLGSSVGWWRCGPQRRAHRRCRPRSCTADSTSPATPTSVRANTAWPPRARANCGGLRPVVAGPGHDHGRPRLAAGQADGAPDPRAASGDEDTLPVAARSRRRRSRRHPDAAVHGHGGTGHGSPGRGEKGVHHAATPRRASAGGPKRGGGCPGRWSGTRRSVTLGRVVRAARRARPRNSR